MSKGALGDCWDRSCCPNRLLLNCCSHLLLSAGTTKVGSCSTRRWACEALCLLELSCCVECRSKCQRTLPQSALWITLGAPTPADLAAWCAYLSTWAASCAAVWAILIVVQVSDVTYETCSSASIHHRCATQILQVSTMMPNCMLKHTRFISFLIYFGLRSSILHNVTLGPFKSDL